MKRIFIFLIGLMLLLFVGCSTPNGENIATLTPTPESANPPDLSEQTLERSDVFRPAPPFMLTFDGIDSFEELRSMMWQNETAFENYLDKMDFSMNGLRTRNDAEVFVEAINNAYFPILSDAPLPQFTVYNEQPNNILILYNMDSEKIITFRVYYERNSANENLSNIKAESPHSLTLMTGRNESLKYYAFDSSDETDQAINYLLDVDGFFIRVRAFNYENSKDALKDIQIFSFSQLKSLLK